MEERCKTKHTQAVKLSEQPYWKTYVTQRWKVGEMVIGSQAELVTCMQQQILVSAIKTQRAFLNEKAFLFCRRAPKCYPGRQFLNYFYIYPEQFTGAKSQQQTKLTMENSWAKKNNLLPTLYRFWEEISE